MVTSAPFKGFCNSCRIFLKLHCTFIQFWITYAHNNVVKTLVLCSMIQPIQRLIVEDEKIIATNIPTQLTEWGTRFQELFPRDEDALNHLKNNLPDIVIDIQLKGKLDGIENAKNP